MKKFFPLCLLFILYILPCSAQFYTRNDTIPVKMNGNWLKMSWVGGHNYVQFSDIDLNFDGIKDLVVFDRTGDKITCYINQGTPNQVDYIGETSTYASKFPHIEDWMLIRDYNCDGLPDIFTYAISVGGVKVWKNTSSGGNLQFTLQTPYLKSNYGSSTTNLYVSRVDVPAIDDIDGDGDLDVITMDYTSTILEYHINKSEELGYGCDSLIFDLDTSGCWGHFNEDQFNCNVYLNNCRMMNPDTSGHIHPFASPPRGEIYPIPKDEENKTQTEENNFSPVLRKASSTSAHAGNCTLCLDMNGDKSKEVVLGQITCCNLIMLTNSGTPTSAHFTAKDTTFPSSNIQASLSLFPCGYFVDVNNDNKRDLIVCPNAPNVSVDNENIWYYENMGTDSTPVFVRQTKSLFQEDMIDVGEGADPVFFDFDNDGLTDMLISNYAMIHDSCAADYRYGVWAFKNIGTATDPKFNLVDTNYANLSNQLPDLPSKHLTFGDIDGDGDIDMFVGDFNGNLQYFENTAGAGNPPNFILNTQNYPDDSSSPIDVGSYATPQLIDVDRDGILDLIIGNRAGNIAYYENTGTTTAPVFSLATSNFGGVHTFPLTCCTGYSVPFMYDSAGSYRLLVGSEADNEYPPTGWIWYYKNIDGNLFGNFTLVDSMYQNIWEGARMTVNGKDINNDGKMDLLIGNYSGGAAIYMGNSSPTSVSEEQSHSFDFSIYPNPTHGTFALQMNKMKSSIINCQVSIYDMFGEKVFTSTITQPLSVFNLDLSAGVYFCQLNRSGQKSVAKKLVVLK